MADSKEQERKLMEGGGGGGGSLLPPPYEPLPSVVVTANQAASPPANKADLPAATTNVVYQFVAPPEVPAREAPDHLVMAILATVFCCLPLGVVGIVRASECKAQRAVGNRELALAHSRAAKTWSLWAILLGTASSILCGVLWYVWLRQLSQLDMD